MAALARSRLTVLSRPSRLTVTVPPSPPRTKIWKSSASLSLSSSSASRPLATAGPPAQPVTRAGSSPLKLPSSLASPPGADTVLATAGARRLRRRRCSRRLFSLARLCCRQSPFLPALLPCPLGRHRHPRRWLRRRCRFLGSGQVPLSAGAGWAAPVSTSRSCLTPPSVAPRRPQAASTPHQAAVSSQASTTRSCSPLSPGAPLAARTIPHATVGSQRGPLRTLATWATATPRARAVAAAGSRPSSLERSPCQSQATMSKATAHAANGQTIPCSESRSQEGISAWLMQSRTPTGWSAASTTSPAASLVVATRARRAPVTVHLATTPGHPGTEVQKGRTFGANARQAHERRRAEWVHEHPAFVSHHSSPVHSSNADSQSQRLTHIAACTAALTTFPASSGAS